MTKKYFFLYVLVAMFTLSLSSCSKDKDDNEPEEPKVLTVKAQVTVNDVTFGSLAAIVQDQIQTEYNKAIEEGKFTSKSEAIKELDELYSAHKSMYEKVIKDGKVVVTVDGAEAKTYDYSFAKSETVTVDTKALVNTWRFTRTSDSNGIGNSWSNADKAEESRNGFQFKADGTCEAYYTGTGTGEYTTKNGTYTVNGAVLTITLPNDAGTGNSTTKYDVLYFTAKRMVLRAENSKECLEYRNQISIRYKFTMSEDLSKLLSKKVLKYFNGLNEVIEYNMATTSSFELTEVYPQYPIKGGLDLDYTIDEEGYTEGETVYLGYSWSHSTIYGGGQDEATVGRTVAASAFTSMAKIKEFVESMRKDMRTSCVLIMQDGTEIEYSFADLVDVQW